MFLPLTEASRLLKIPRTMIENIRVRHPEAHHLFCIDFSPKTNWRVWHVACPEIRTYLLNQSYYREKLKPQIDSPRPPRNAPIDEYKAFLRKNYTAQYEVN